MLSCVAFLHIPSKERAIIECRNSSVDIVGKTTAELEISCGIPEPKYPTMYPTIFDYEDFMDDYMPVLPPEVPEFEDLLTCDEAVEVECGDCINGTLPFINATVVGVGEYGNMTIDSVDSPDAFNPNTTWFDVYTFKVPSGYQNRSGNITVVASTCHSRTRVDTYMTLFDACPVSNNVSESNATMLAANNDDGTCDDTEAGASTVSIQVVEDQTYFLTIERNAESDVILTDPNATALDYVLCISCEEETPPVLPSPSCDYEEIVCGDVIEGFLGYSNRTNSSSGLGLGAYSYYDLYLLKTPVHAENLTITVHTCDSRTPGAFLGVIFIFLTIAIMCITWFLLHVWGKRTDTKERRIRELVRRYGNTGTAGSVGAVGVLLEFRNEFTSSLERSLPMAFRLKPWEQFKYLMMNKHDLVSLLFYYSPNCGRHVRVAIVMSGIFSIMAMEVLLYQFTYVDPGCGPDSPIDNQLPLQVRETKLQCECVDNTRFEELGINFECQTGPQPFPNLEYMTRESETKEYGSPGTFLPACYFRENSIGCNGIPDHECTNGVCEFREPSESIESSMLMAILGGILILPIIYIQLWIFENWLMPPVDFSSGSNPILILLAYFGLGDDPDVGLNELEEAEIQDMNDEEFEREVDHETEERVANLKIQREELVQKIMGANLKLMKFKRQVKQKERRSDPKRLAELNEEVREWQNMLRCWDLEFGFGKDGRLRPGGLKDRIFKTTPLDKIKKKVRRELEDTRALLDSIAPRTVTGARDWEGTSELAIPEQDRHTLIWEQHRMDRLSFMAREVYQQNALEFDEQPMEPVKIWKKTLGWGIVVGFNVACIVHTLVWCLTVTVNTANSWFAAFFIGTLQDLCVFLPVKLIVQNLVMPLIVRDEIREKHNDLSSNNGILFSVKFAKGAAERVAVMDLLDAEISRDPAGIREAREPLQVSQLIVEANHLQTLVPGVGLDEESPAARRKRLRQEKIQRANRLVRRNNNGWVLKVQKYLLFFLFLLLILPMDLQDMLIETILPLFWGFFVVGLDIAATTHITAAAMPVLFFILLGTAWRFFTKRQKRIRSLATKAPPGKLEVLFRKILRRKQREFNSESSGISLLGSGIEANGEYVASSEFDNAGMNLSTNPILGDEMNKVNGRIDYESKYGERLSHRREQKHEKKKEKKSRRESSVIGGADDGTQLIDGQDRYEPRMITDEKRQKSVKSGGRRKSRNSMKSSSERSKGTGV